MSEPDEHAPEEMLRGDDAPTGNWIEEILAGYVDRLNRGEKILPEQILFEHPDSGEEILFQLEAWVGSRRFAETTSPGESLGKLGDYTLRRQIGRGGMGIVYDAWQNSVDRQVALKVLPAGVAADTRTVTRFVREAKTAAQLHHPNVVPVFGMGVEQDTPYYAMELVDGETLGEIIRKLKDVSPDGTTPFGFPRDDVAYYTTLARAFADVAEGLQHAHSKGVIHRDIKPSNLILDTEGRLRILDFGLARLEGQESVTLSGDFVGTPLYMSPEQARRHRIKVDHRTDIYSLGATMYEMLALRPPFRGKDHQDTLSQIISSELEDLRKHSPRVPRELETIVLKCLRKDPLDRYGTAEALAQDLRRFVRGDPVEARAEAPLDRLIRRLWRHRVVGSSVIFGCLLVVTTALLWSYRAEKTQRLHRELFESRVLGAVMKIELARDFRRHVAPRSEYGGVSLFAGFGGATDASRLEETQATDWSHAVTSAVGGLREAMALVPGAVDAPYHLSRALRLLGKDGEARDVLDEALRSHPTFVPAQVLREEFRSEHETNGRQRGESAVATGGDDPAWTRHWLEANRAMEKNRHEIAVESYSALLVEISPGDAPFLGLYMEARLGRGRARLSVDDFDGAIEDFAAARERWPELTEPELLLGKAYWRRGDEERAEKVFESLHRRRGEDEVALGVTGILRSLREWETGLAWAERIQNPTIRERKRAYFLLRLHRLEEAREAARKAITHSPDDAYLYYELGQVLARQKRFQDAAIAYSTAIEKNNDLLVAYDARAQARAHLGDNEGALADLSVVLEREPGSASGAFLHHMHLREIWSGGPPERALANWNRVIELQRDHPWNYVSRGDVYFWNGDHELARADYTTAVDMDSPWECFLPPMAAYAYAQRGQTWAAQGEHERAIEDYTRAIELASTPTEIRPDPKPQDSFYINRAISKESIRDFEGALDDYDRARELAPRKAEPLVRRGDLLIWMEDLDGAIVAHEKATELDPKHGRSHFSLGHALRLKGEHKRAIECFDRAIDLDPKNWQAYVGRALAHDALGDTSSAMDGFDQAVESQPENVGLHIYRASFLAKKGLVEDAQRGVEGIQHLADKFSATELYNLACVFSIASSKVEATGDEPELATAGGTYTERAIEYLRRSIAAGWKNFDHMREDPDFEPLRDLREFKRLLEESGGGNSGVKTHPDD